MARSPRTRSSSPTPEEVPAAKPAPPPAAHLRARRSPRLIAIGLLLACLGGLGAALAYQRASHANQVVVVAHAVPRGVTIRSTDLGVVTIGAAPGVSTVSAEQLGQLVGKQALVDLPAGSLVGRDSVGTTALPAGSAQLGLRLAAGRVPNQTMPPGTPIQLVEVSGEQAATSPLTIEATLLTAPQVLPDGSTRLLDVSVPESQAQRIADLAAHELLVVVRKPGG